MGADEKSNLQKCGEILINIKAKNKKTKTYTFNCLFCEENFDQLKKFNLHLEEKHFQILVERNSGKTVDPFEPEIKLEEHLEIESTNVLKNTIKTALYTEGFEDPLDTFQVVETSNTDKSLEDIKIKVEDDFNDGDYDNFSDEDCVNDDDDYKPSEKRSKNNYKAYSVSAEGSSDDSDNDNDEVNTITFQDKVKNSKTKGRIKHRRSKESQPDTNVEEKELIKALFQSFEKQTFLWDIQERTNDKSICQIGFETIAKEVNEKLNTNITWNFARNRINAMRIKCSYELEKQLKGEEYQIPWYFEHMQYLQENIDFMIKKRRNIDQSLLPILIQLYKKYDDLWQVNKITFGIPAKRDEALKKIIEDLKLSHNLDLTTCNLHGYIKYINSLYSKDKELQLKCELEKTEFIPTCQYYEELSFLNESQGPFKCDTCNEIIRKYKTYLMHVGNHHNTRPFKCPICEMAFKTFSTYILHAKRHLRLNSFPCNVCGKVYAFRKELINHLTGHTGEKPFLCQICGTSFRAHHNYDNHVRRHEKRFRHECHICKQGFNQLSKLNEHVKCHLNIRDVFCDICGKGFTCKRYLNNHKLIHEDKKRYKCNVCGKEFAQGAGYRAHRKQHQPHLTAAEIKRKKESTLNSLDM